jgi:hypothetical protein
MINFFVCLGVLMMSVYLVRQYLGDQRSIQYAKTHLFDEVLSLLDGAILKQEGNDFPQVSGSFAGYEVKFSLIEDTVAVRKIPPLWLMVTVKGKVPINGTFDLIVRPSNNEFYSPAWQWNGNVQVPSHWPQHAVIKYQDSLIDVAKIDHFVPILFADERAKELLINPSVLRITYMAKQAERGEYLIMRNSVFSGEAIAEEVVAKVLKQAIEIRQLLEKDAYEPTIQTQIT